MDYYSKDRGPSFHPGGFALTKYAVDFCKFEKGAKLCDIGCGNGETKDRLENEYGYNVCGVEPSEAMGGGRADIIFAKAEKTGLSDETFDGVLFECVLSLCDDLKASVKEAKRILKKGGYIIVSDVYSKSGKMSADGPLRWVYPESEFKSLINELGFETVLYEDHTKEMLTMAAQMIMDGAGEEMCALFSSLRKIRCGYFLLIARRMD